MILQIKNFLVEKLAYSEVAANSAAPKLQRLNGPLAKAFFNYMQTGIETEIKLGERSTRELQDLGMTYPAALLALEWSSHSDECDKVLQALD